MWQWCLAAEIAVFILTSACIGGHSARNAQESIGVKECKLGTLRAGGERLVEAANMGLTGLLLLLFVAILAGAAGQADWSLLAATAHWDAAPRAVSIIFLSLVRAR